ncbi:MAG TPA: tRNA dihydrouridine(20/20a) synthase DusA [Gammaproteobacteria bacterium]|nr:tRNA dihydrouridine(20/20a) synthase DusA [Gammaproteobacteria bacterium]HBX98781.1 tRNA dihydrouridine(20/20a) synthase DusA [Gammaproteobacteria bacterium]
MLDHRFCIAPMMDWTDRHDRVFLRLFTTRALLYTEMVTSAALEHGDANYLLKHHASEHPVALQLGGSNPKELAKAAELGEQACFDEINLNVGCPSDRVQSGKFGASLMADPQIVSNCVSAIKQSTRLPVTVKCRIGVDDKDTHADLVNFINVVATGGCELFVIHARKAYLQGLSPKENREIPPLNYERVFAVKQEFPELNFIINGGITSINEALSLLEKMDGVMIGREAYNNPYFLREVDNRIFGDLTSEKSRTDYLYQYLPYIESQLTDGASLHHMTRHLMGLFKGQKGGKLYRRHLSEYSHKKEASINVLLDAIAYVE